MLILGVETSTRQVAVALGEATEGRVTVLGQATAARDARHAETLAPAVAFVCRSVGVAPADLDGLAVGLGPGLFTGLRVGVATVQAMALALDVPVVGVSSLDVVAHGVRGTRGPLLVAMDARRGELFWAPYRAGTSAGPCRKGPDRADPPDEVASAAGRLAEGDDAEGGGGVVVVGDGPDRYPDAFAALAARCDVVVVGGPAGLPSAAVVVELGARSFDQGRAGPAAGLVPAYVREPDAVRWPSAPQTPLDPSASRPFGESQQLSGRRSA